MKWKTRQYQNDRNSSNLTIICEGGLGIIKKKKISFEMFNETVAFVCLNTKFNYCLVNWLNQIWNRSPYNCSILQCTIRLWVTVSNGTWWKYRTEIRFSHHLWNIKNGKLSWIFCCKVNQKIKFPLFSIGKNDLRMMICYDIANVMNKQSNLMLYKAYITETLLVTVFIHSGYCNYLFFHKHISKWNRIYPSSGM